MSAILASDGLAVALGQRLAGRVSGRWVRWSAAGLFFAFAGASLWAALA
ncbi:MAG TPA: TMEM165/GDT1 family protein [Anaeromyxobacter sp.]|nr:TMEM165/GDT1 family protein [Anaeromyxobacter sp.]